MRSIETLSPYYYAIKWKPYDPDHVVILGIVSQIPGAFFDERLPAWVIPHTELKWTVNLPNFFIPPEVLAQVEANEKMAEASVASENIDLDIPLPDPALKLYPYQVGGVNFAECVNGKVLIADEMGLGKTIQALAFLNRDPENRLPAMVVSPTSVLKNWEREGFKWCFHPDKIHVIGYERLRLDFDYSENIEKKTLRIKYPKFGTKTKEILDQGIKTLIIDECHRIKNYKARQSKAVRWVAKRVQFRLGLTGTPILNKHMDLYNILDTIHPGLYKFNYFTNKFCQQGYWGGYNINKNGDLLNQELRSNIMVRRLKKDVLKDLPDMMYTTVPVTGMHQEDYETALEAYMEDEGMDDEFEARESFPMVAWIANKRKEVGIFKADFFLKWILDWEEDGGGPMVIFCWHKSTALEIFQLLKGKKLGCEMVTGNSTPKEKDRCVQEFQNSEKIKYIVATNCLSEGVTLTKASDMAIVEYPYRPADLDQQCARIHRIGQKSVVNIRFFHGEDTVDDAIAALINYKRSVFNVAINDVEWIADRMKKQKAVETLDFGRFE